MIRILLFCCFTIFCTVTANVAALEIELGQISQAPCSKAEWSNNGAFGLASPTLRYGSQSLIIKAIIGAPSLEQQALPPDQLQQQSQLIFHCAQIAGNNVGVMLMATNPSESNGLFQSIFMQCIQGQAPISYVSLRTESNCQW